MNFDHKIHLMHKIRRFDLKICFIASFKVFLTIFWYILGLFRFDEFFLSNFWRLWPNFFGAISRAIFAHHFFFAFWREQLWPTRKRCGGTGASRKLAWPALYYYRKTYINIYIKLAMSKPEFEKSKVEAQNLTVDF